MKKLVSLVIVMALVMSLAVGASAEESTSGTITISGAVNGQTYSAYKVFSVTASGDNYSYTIDSSSAFYNTVNAFATEDNGMKLTQVNGSNTYNVSVTETFTAAKAADLAAALAATLAEGTSNPISAGSATAANGAASISVSEAGYYFVNSSLGSLCALNTVNATTQVYEKNSLPSLTKAVDKANVSIGDSVTFTLTANTGSNTNAPGEENSKTATGISADYKIEDTLPAGLTYDSTAGVTVKVGDTAWTDTDYTVSYANQKLTITLSNTKLTTLIQNTSITITYKATLNENAVIAGTGNTNAAKLTYGTYTTENATATVYTYSFDLVKTDSDNKIITGAQFKLYNAQTGGNQIYVVKNTDGSYSVTKTANEVVIEAGNVKIKGLANGTYWLEETKAPEGYNALTARQSFEIKNANLDAIVTTDTWTSDGVHVINQTGSVLPSTGGVGTTIFYALGGLMFVGALVLLVTNKRMKAE